jgi:hypothetical protein
VQHILGESPMAPCSSQEYFSLQSAFRRPSALQPGDALIFANQWNSLTPFAHIYVSQDGAIITGPKLGHGQGPSPLNRGNLERFRRELSREVKLPKFGRYCHILPRFRIEHRKGYFDSLSITIGQITDSVAAFFLH